MIKDIRLGVSIIKYGLNFYVSISVVFFLLGLLALNMILFPTPLFATIFIPLVMMGIVQQVYTTTVSTMVQSSPYKKKLRTTVPTYMAMIEMIIGNTLSLVLHWISYLRTKDNPSIVLEYDTKLYANTILICAVLMVIVLVYTVLGNVFFGPCVIIAIGGWIGLRWLIRNMEFVGVNISIEVAVVLSYIVVLIGTGILYLVNNMIYKYEYAEMSFRGFIKRASK